MTNALEIRDYIASLSALYTDPYQPPTVVDAKPITKSVDGIGYNLEQQTLKMVTELSEFAVLNPVQDVLWPGAVIQGETLQSGNLASVNLKRAPGTLTLTTNLPGATGVHSKIVASPSLASIRDARMGLLRELNPRGSTGAVSFFKATARSFEQSMLEVGAHYNSAPADVKGHFKIENDLEKNTLLIRFFQEFYTVAFQPTDDVYFADEVTRADLERYCAETNPPCVLSSVTYGRSLFIMISARASRTELEAACEAMFRGGAASGGVEISGAHKKVLTSSAIRVLGLGGRGEAQVELLADPIAGLQRYLSDGAVFSLEAPGAPIAFTARYLGNGQVAKVSLAAEYSQTTVGYANNENKDITVCKGGGRTPCSTEIRIAQGDRYTISARGEIWSGVFATGKNGPKGWFDAALPGDRKAGKDCPLPDHPPFSLVARLDNDDWFYVGDNSGERKHEGATKTLWLSINDSDAGRGDDCFSVNVIVLREAYRPPGAVECD